MSEKIRVMLVDDQQLFREGMAILINATDDLIVVGEAGNGLEAIVLYAELRPDVVLMDVQMPEMNGIEATRRILAMDPEAKLLVLTTFDNDEYIFEGMRAGAVGYILKAMSSEELAKAVRVAHQGDVWIEVSVARKLVNELARIPLSSDNDTSSLVEPLNEREQEVLNLIAKGLKNREIATELHLAEGTVKNYVTSLMRKMYVEDRVQVVVRAKMLGLV
ncbi:MAG: response regulator transcription factor [Caldilineaceae bacterium SB0670_bin_27]|uniref:Response regulator transcription factor n=1 Tax=Caldilineaceae bacterium SB0664_bin_27 TaxID=2605260 RepID=A0A6B0YQV0_9CHLR|nr:response regulator transcription factor [Caldilineaceae bacterium]MDE0339511.1 response regulator transcription factor [Caldilineaceae bacterium]MXY92152.1 response regulator transcription factor [Caldilineaceae bacterium SB0664_bin_27]MYJ79032.1 response regulator transcription factor [Caldilineaceae bacterium SB0670_bin_27]